MSSKDGVILLLLIILENRPMILQLEHQHNKKQQAPTLLPKAEFNSVSRVIKKVEIVEQQQPSIFYQPSPYQSISSFNFHIDGLELILNQSLNFNPNNVTNRIQERKRFCEDRVYEAIVNPTVNFVNLHMNDFQKGIKIQLAEMFEGIHNAVEAGVWDGRYEIDYSKNKYFTSVNKERELVSFITEELVKRNIDNFKKELDTSEANDFLDTSSIHPKSENYKAKQAQDFVKKMNEDQAHHRRSVERIKEKHQQLNYKSLEDNKLREEERKRQRLLKVQKRIQNKQTTKQFQKQKQKQLHTDYMKLISTRKKPLYEQIQEKYRLSILEEQKQKYKMMKQNKQRKGPISFEEISEHLIRYEQLREQSEAFRQQKRQLKQHEQMIIASRRPYRSKFYSMVVNQMPKISQKEVKTSLIKRQQDYTEYVKQNYIPKVDEKKQQEIEQLMKKVTASQNKVYHSRKYIDEGKRNLQKLHQLIAELRAKNRIKPSLTIEELNQINRPEVKKYPNYLEQLKVSKMVNGQQEVNFQKMITDKNQDWIQLQAHQKEQKAKQKQKYLDSNMQVIDIHTHMKGKSSVEKDYLESAKAKMALLKRYNFDQEEKQTGQRPRQQYN